MAAVSKRSAARRDLIEHYIYLAETAGIETADRFLARAEVTLADLLAQPRIGAPLDSGRVKLANASEWRKDPDTGKRRRIMRPRSEWISYVDESLRIVTDDLWERAQRRTRPAIDRAEEKRRELQELQGGAVLPNKAPCHLAPSGRAIPPPGGTRPRWPPGRDPEGAAVLVRVVRREDSPRAAA